MEIYGNEDEILYQRLFKMLMQHSKSKRKNRKFEIELINSTHETNYDNIYTNDNNNNNNSYKNCNDNYSDNYNSNRYILDMKELVSVYDVLLRKKDNNNNNNDESKTNVYVPPLVQSGRKWKVYNSNGVEVAVYFHIEDADAHRNDLIDKLLAENGNNYCNENEDNMENMYSRGMRKKDQFARNVIENDRLFLSLEHELLLNNKSRIEDVIYGLEMNQNFVQIMKNSNIYCIGDLRDRDKLDSLFDSHDYKVFCKIMVNGEKIDLKLRNKLLEYPKRLDAIEEYCNSKFNDCNNSRRKNRDRNININMNINRMEATSRKNDIRHIGIGLFYTLNRESGINESLIICKRIGEINSYNGYDINDNSLRFYLCYSGGSYRFSNGTLVSFKRKELARGNKSIRAANVEQILPPCHGYLNYIDQSV